MARDASDRPRSAPSSSATPLVVCSTAMLDVMRLVACYARARTPVVLVGETGTGKGLIAKELHRASGRSGPFVVLTAAELRGTLGADVLFGHAAGAFTGAAGRREGMLAQAAAGTLLIDDFHHLRAAQQIKLLRVLEEGWWRPQGADREVPVQLRVVVTLPRSPDALMRAGRLLPDIRYRLGNALVAIPRLAQRRDDIPVLAAHFLDQAPEATGVPGGPGAFADGVSRLLQLGDWPGNVRELRDAVQIAYLHAGAEGSIEMEHLPASALGPLRYTKGGRSARAIRGIELALTLAQGNIARAARLTGASRATVYRTLAALERRPARPSHESCSIRRVTQTARSQEASA